jgi:hypothetical protein
MTALHEHQLADPGWRQIHRYAYIKRSYEDVWTAIAADHTRTVPGGVRCDGTGRLDLRVRLAGVEVTRPVTVRVGGLVVKDERSRLALSWWDKGHRNLFPVLEAVLELAPADFRGCRITQIGLVGRYRPPFGVFGSAVDRVAGFEIVAESVMKFVQDFAQRIEAGVPAVPAPAAGDGPDDHDQTALGHRVFLPVDGLACRSGGAVTTRRLLSSLPGVSVVELDPIAGIAAVDYDPDRNTPEDLWNLLEADARR